MLAGKWISKMFEPDLNKQILINYERLSYEFTCDMHYLDFSKLLESYFTKLCKGINYIYYESGKVQL